MRRTLLAGIAVLALTLPPMQSATAQWVVKDPFNLIEAVRRFEELQRHYRMLESQLRTAENTLASLRNSGNAAGLANQLLSMRNPLGRDAQSVIGVLSGRTDGGLLDGLLNGTMDRNRIYENPGTDFYATEQNRRRQAIAGQQAAAQEILQQALERIPLLDELQAELHRTEDPGEKLALIARLNAEQAHLENLKVKADAVREFARAEEVSFSQRKQEQVQMEIDEAIEALEGARARRSAPGGSAPTTPSSFNSGPMAAAVTP